MSFVDLAAGVEFGGRYRVVGRLAAGGMGTVYEVVHLETERRCALKVMQADLFQNAGLRERFRNEARVTAQVRSDSLVDVLDAGVDAATGMPFLVMELLMGEDLGRRVERCGALPPEEVVIYLAQVASALDRTHAASIVHRDLKPANLFLAELVDGSTRVKILDFGISKIVSEANAATSRTLGTPAYMAPEQLLGEPVSAATDVHALGLIAYTLLAGQSYWQEDVESVDNVFAFALRAQEGPREDAILRAARQGHELPAAFGSWFERATARDPKDRFQRASSAVAALAETLGVRAGASVPLSGSHSMSVDAPPIPGERRVFSGLRWLLIPGALLVLVGIFSLFQSRAVRQGGVAVKPEPSVQRALPQAEPAARILPPREDSADFAAVPSTEPSPVGTTEHPSKPAPRDSAAGRGSRPGARPPRPLAAPKPSTPPAEAVPAPAVTIATPPRPPAPRPAEKPLHHTRD